MTCPKCSAPLETVHLPGGFEIDSCPQCHGVFYDAAEFALTLKLKSAMKSALACPKCESPMEVGGVFDGSLTVDRCTSCQGLWFDSGEVVKLRRLSGAESLLGKPGQEDVSDLPRRLQAQANLRKEAAQANPPAPPDCGNWDNPDIQRNPVIDHEGRRYQHFQTSKPMVSFVLGEFNWKVKAGETATARDFICPPYLLSEDVTPEGSAWSHGDYLDPSEVWLAFGLSGSPPVPRGVAPAQPNPHAAAWDAAKPVFWAAVLGGLLVFAAAALLCQKAPVPPFGFTYAVTDPQRAKVSMPFELGGRTSNVRVKTHAELSNNWAFFRMALINTRTDEAIEFARDLAYYWGSEDGEAWSEGSRSDTVHLPSVPAGTYYLRVEPESDASGFPYGIEITRDVPRPAYLFWALGLLCLPPLWWWWRNRRFEIQRWQESDHPWVTTDDDEEDEE